jgi:16S rRNA (guanine966-N2)-methyltransferase
MGELRLIGGQWKRTKLSFPLLPGVRPTPSRVRETLFNWLAMDIAGSHCLDLFAGSGALGLEALSRGAASCTFVDQQPEICRQIQQHLNKLGAANARVIQGDALAVKDLSFATGQQPEIIFIDPPFHQDWLPGLISALDFAEWFKHCRWLYIETEKELTHIEVPANWTLEREKTAGDVCYRLYLVS